MEEDGSQRLIVASRGLPKRCTRELQALQSNQQMDAEPPANRTRAKTRKTSSMTSMAKAFCTAAAIANCCISPQKAAARQFPLQTFCAMANAVLDGDTGEMLEYRQLLRHPKLGPAWNTSGANEIGRLAQGVGGRIKGTNTINFIRKGEVPPERFKDCTYGRFVCVVRPQKAEPNRTRLTAGGNLINYPGEVQTPTADMLLVKILFNSVVSSPNAKFMSMDISNFYLETPLKQPEYMRLKLADIPEEIIAEYNLRDKVTSDGYVYIEIV